MNRESCHVMEELLVDFADSVLAGEEAAAIREHLEQCPRCRTTVEALRQSLEAAQCIWQNNTHRVGQPQAIGSRRWRHVAAAAGIALAVGVALLWSPRHQSVKEVPTLGKIENRMAQSGAAARLLAAADLLEAQPSLHEMAQDQYRHILAEYPDTAAAESARLRLQPLR